MAALGNEMERIPGELVIVLDDYDVIEERAVHSAVAFLLNHLPENVYLLIASRSDPPLPVARLRARGELVEVRAADLAFNLAETEDFLERHIGSEVGAEEVAVLHSRTEGWPAGLRLAAASLRDHRGVATFLREFRGSHRYVFDYLAEEVMIREPERVQVFLSQTSILGRLCGPLCDAVTGGADGQALLERLDRANLFVIPLDDDRHLNVRSPRVVRWLRFVVSVDQQGGQIHELHCGVSCKRHATPAGSQT
jgi:LuxR family maltose regulon positive regulatory protein